MSEEIQKTVHNMIVGEIKKAKWSIERIQRELEKLERFLDTVDRLTG